MSYGPLAFIEFFVVLAFLIGWFVLERVASRYDRKPDAKTTQPDDPKQSPD